MKHDLPLYPYIRHFYICWFMPQISLKKYHSDMYPDKKYIDFCIGNEMLHNISINHSSKLETIFDGIQE